MGAYIIRRLLLMIPTLFGIMLVVFVVVQFTPGGPVEQQIARLQGIDISATARITGGEGDLARQEGQRTVVNAEEEELRNRYRGAQGLSAESLRRLEAQFGFDKPPVERFFTMLWNYIRFDFGESYFRDISVVDLIGEKMPVSISLGLWMTLIGYAIAIPLGIRKAVKDGTPFDRWTSLVVIIGYSIPAFLFAVALIILFAGGSYLDLFPLRFLTSSGWDSFPWYQKVLDYFWHLVLPVTCLAIGAFATSTLLVKNVFLDEIRKQYVITARAKGLTEKRIIYRHIFRNAMLLVIAGFPGAFIGAFFAGSLLIETIFSLDGLGYLGFVSVIQRDYPIMFATLYVFTLIGLLIGLLSDITYTWIDPRIDFASRRV